MPKASHFTDFRQAIVDFPQQFTDALKLLVGFKIDGQFDHILVSGMGGSAWPAEILEAYLQSQKINALAVNRNYNLPLDVQPKTLAVFSSYSGNTEETLSAYNQAKENNLKIVAITTGGQLQKLCAQDNNPCLIIPAGLVPRMASGYLFTALAGIVAQTIAGQENILADIAKLADNLKPETSAQAGEKLAEKIKGKLPLIYTSQEMKILGYIWETKLNEGAKTPAFSDFFPRLDHDELSIFTKPDFNIARPFVIILKDKNDQERVIKRMDVTAEMIKAKNVEVEEINLSNPSFLNRVFSNIILCDWVTLFLAQKYQTDPLATELQEEFKKKIT